VSSIRGLEYLDASSRSPFRRWFGRLDATAAARIGVYLYRLEQGNFSRVEGVGGGVFELRMDFGPGYRVYFGKDGEKVVVLLGGSTKKDQDAAIKAALESWQDYKRRIRA
jgi:putative addiction module killer protein